MAVSVSTRCIHCHLYNRQFGTEEILDGKYLNPKYKIAKLRRRKQRRVAVLSTLALSLCIIGATSIHNIDLYIRSTTLPAALPAFIASDTDFRVKSFYIMGQGVTVDLNIVHAIGEVFGDIFTTPPAAMRLFYQLDAYITNDIPPNIERNGIVEYK